MLSVYFSQFLLLQNIFLCCSFSYFYSKYFFSSSYSEGKGRHNFMGCQLAFAFLIVLFFCCDFYDSCELFKGKEEWMLSKMVNVKSFLGFLL